MRHILLILAFFLTATVVAAQIAERDLREISPDSPVKGSLVIQGLRPEGDRLDVDLEAQLPSLFDEIDNTMRARGNLGDCGARLYWRGPTRMRSGGAELKVRTRIAAEVWICSDFLETILAKSTHDADLILSHDWDDRAKKLHVDIRIDNIRDFPDEVEGVLRDYGVPFSRRFEVPIGDRDSLARLDPSLESLRFEANGARGVTLAATLSANSAAAIAQLREATGFELSEWIGQSANRFGRWFLGR